MSESTQPRERPILFQGAMVRALLAGTKTQTRRAFKLPRGHSWDELQGGMASGHIEADRWPGTWHASEFRCPYGQPGDRLWVRENFGRVPTACEGEELVFAADFSDGSDRAAGVRYTPSIHMPRALSRILLEITEVRVERLQDISELDADAEGCDRLYETDPGYVYRGEPDERDWKICPKCGGTRLHNALGANLGVIFDVDCQECDTYIKRYRHLWESINGQESWASNPWVWVVSFKVVQP